MRCSHLNRALGNTRKIMSYPNGAEWSALKSIVISNQGDQIELSTISCGKLNLPSGKLVTCDPFAGMTKSGNSFVQVPPGEYEVIVTLADVSSNLDGTHIREAYASLIIDKTKIESSRKFLEPTKNGEPTNQILQAGEFWGYGVDAGTACFADADAIEATMPEEGSWYEGLFDNGRDDCWFNQMDSKTLIRKGLANIQLPNSDKNLILFHSGWGDGFYPVIGGYDSNNNLVAVHTDFFVVDISENEVESASKPWWRFW